MCFHLVLSSTESGDESDSSDCSSILQRKHDVESNQPDSGFEEKKVSWLKIEFKFKKKRLLLRYSYAVNQ